MAVERVPGVSLTQWSECFISKEIFSDWYKRGRETHTVWPRRTKAKVQVVNVGTMQEETMGDILEQEVFPG